MIAAGRAKLGDLVIAHYGCALREADRHASGNVPVYGSNGEVGRHNAALADFPTIVIGRKGSVGAVTYAPQGGWPIDTTYYLEITAKEQVDLRYLYWALSSSGLDRRAITTSIPGLSRDDLYRTPIQLPSPAQQRRTAAILDKVDAIRRKRTESLHLLDEFLRSAFLEMFGDCVRNQRQWSKVSLGDLLPDRHLIVDGPFGSSLKPDCYVAAGVRVIRNYNIRDDAFDDSSFKFITPEKFSEVARSEVRPADVLISTKGTLGNVCLMPDLPGASVLSATGTVRLRLPREAPLRREFLVSQMVTPAFKGHLKRFEAGTNQKYLNLAGIRRLEVIVPPLEQQDRWCAFRLRAMELKRHQVAAVNASHGLLQSLVHHVFDEGVP